MAPGTEVGARGRERLLLGPFKWDVEFEVAEAVPGRRIVWRAVDDPNSAPLASLRAALGKAPFHDLMAALTLKECGVQLGEARSRWQVGGV